jgi:hypothetical protein
MEMGRKADNGRGRIMETEKGITKTPPSLKQTINKIKISWRIDLTN